MATTTARIFNFSAGPAILPLEVLEQASAYVSGNTVLMRRAGGSWKIDQSMPTS